MNLLSARITKRASVVNSKRNVASKRKIAVNRKTSVADNSKSPNVEPRKKSATAKKKENYRNCCLRKLLHVKPPRIPSYAPEPGTQCATAIRFNQLPLT